MAVSVVYEHPVAGATPPTALQANDKVVAEIISTADGDVGPAVITHNLGVSVADLAAGFPEILVEQLLPAGWLNLPHVLAANKLTNSVGVTLTNVGSSGNANAQIRVTISRPHTIGR